MLIAMPSGDESRRDKLLQQYATLLRQMHTLRTAGHITGRDVDAQLQQCADSLGALEAAGKQMGLGTDLEAVAVRTYPQTAASVATPSHPAHEVRVPQPHAIDSFLRSHANRPTPAPHSSQPRPAYTQPAAPQRPATASEVHAHGTESFAAQGRDYHRSVDPNGVRTMSMEPGFKRDLLEMAQIAAAAVLFAIGSYAYQKIIAFGHRPFG